jgi:hypothetical protein
VPLERFDLRHEKKVKTAFQLEFIELPVQPFRGYRALLGSSLRARAARPRSGRRARTRDRG